jgi:Tol biopolymer transport system component
MAWSPDGRRIAFLDRSGNEGPHLFVTNTDGTERHQLTHGLRVEWTTLSWSPDGQHILIGRSNPLRIVRVNADGSGERDLTRPGAYESDYSAGWSPDGRTIAFLRRAAPPPFEEVPLQNLWVMDADGANSRNVTGWTFDDIDYFADSYGWAPDSERLAFTHGLGMLSVLRKDGSERRTMRWEKTSIDSPSWSPDGSKIMLMISREFTLRGIALVNPDGTNLTRVAEGAEYVAQAVWQP